MLANVGRYNLWAWKSIPLNCTVDVGNDVKQNEKNIILYIYEFEWTIKESTRMKNGEWFCVKLFSTWLNMLFIAFQAASSNIIISMLIGLTGNSLNMQLIDLNCWLAYQQCKWHVSWNSFTSELSHFESEY